MRGGKVNGETGEEDRNYIMDSPVTVVKEMASNSKGAGNPLKDFR